MSKRFRELKKQSYKEIIETNDYNGSAYTVRKFDSEKFAELIIRECTNIAYEYDAPKLSGPGMIIASRIELHFGIEEND